MVVCLDGEMPFPSFTGCYQTHLLCIAVNYQVIIKFIHFQVPVYIAEIAPKDYRGLFTAINQLMSTFGFGVSFLFGNMISWRILALIGKELFVKLN